MKSDPVCVKRNLVSIMLRLPSAPFVASLLTSRMVTTSSHRQAHASQGDILPPRCLFSTRALISVRTCRPVFNERPFSLDFDRSTFISTHESSESQVLLAGGILDLRGLKYRNGGSRNVFVRPFSLASVLPVQRSMSTWTSWRRSAGG